MVRIQLRIEGGHVTDARFLAFGCGAATAAASVACERLRGASLDVALGLGEDVLDRALGGLGPERIHGPQTVADALARALERWYSDRLGTVGLPQARDRVAVAMSGGVDSAVAALRLRDAGFDVVGVTMRLWHDPHAAAAERSCCSPETVQMARRTAHLIGIPHLTIDAAETFRRGVVESFIAGYRGGETPNPCVTCNGSVRFTVLGQAAALLGARRMATGHYARVEGDTIARARDTDKDQSYMLARLDRATIGRLEFPLGELTKAETRELAASAALPAADAVESQEVCFVGARGYVPFLERAGLTPTPGDIVDEDGLVVGRHDGYWRYTVGQRRGIGIASPVPLYVLATNAEANTVTVGPRESLAATVIHLHSVTRNAETAGSHLDVRVRYRGRALRGSVEPSAAGLTVRLDDPADGVAPGQTAVLYRDGQLVAAGVIGEGELGGKHRLG
jgi:tRNA-specific 2-thiouridylase